MHHAKFWLRLRCDDIGREAGRPGNIMPLLTYMFTRQLGIGIPIVYFGCNAIQRLAGEVIFTRPSVAIANAALPFAPLMDDASVKPFHQNITTVLTRVWERRQKFEPTGQIE